MKIKHLRSRKDISNGGGVIASDRIDYGEIAINYHKGDETIFIKNDNDEIVSFKDNNFYEGELNKKQNTLISGENIKTIVGENILGSGDINIPLKFSVNNENKLVLNNRVISPSLKGDSFYAFNDLGQVGLLREVTDIIQEHRLFFNKNEEDGSVNTPLNSIKNNEIERYFNEVSVSSNIGYSWGIGKYVLKERGDTDLLVLVIRNVYSEKDTGYVFIDKTTNEMKTVHGKYRYLSFVLPRGHNEFYTIYSHIGARWTGPLSVMFFEINESTTLKKSGNWDSRPLKAPENYLYFCEIPFEGNQIGQMLIFKKGNYYTLNGVLAETIYNT